ncbi:MAG: hypothetical protein GWM92_17635, partial [Gemmatimonadetes bacterium]|nr:hypothetical protein [Gemmatimonadota bacterium]NIR78199.1 hypothetical protein [Gemmatimonadota bacterium]NIT89382.1 hypothetical protein [Gemmatimonadota bacterium]NIU30349.1 hypothetical protein [Gemmatimonadota bacterium]NIU35234.1 hypothetical protein [Gemmatimonadota bacterium]
MVGSSGLRHLPLRDDHRPTVCDRARRGGAWGFAHAGVLRALERGRRLPPGGVGVSTGAVVGATYARRECAPAGVRRWRRTRESASSARIPTTPGPWRVRD